ncbi:restriction endonuclease subunit S [Thermanaerosceptrum fracticalcis]|uniref:Restriction endonuclease subunit S n=1 Tax=Thermanaerosceptrum fracticalcis TaxID=1712410 RepID=A0A7G6E6T2_THEFR|nr:restriction endonuclease subunit S [Thermanaerosceptrum fracticalcis]QNB47786.1 restriction endonuclease subunit S [Thermanaerosceptrum fracticalcis]
MSVGEWREVKLGDEIELLYGKGLVKTKRNNNGNVPVYGSNGLIGFHDEALINGPGVIIGRKGTVGSVNYSSVPFFPIDTTYYLNPRNNDLKFMYYFLQTLGLSNMNTHSAVPGLNRDNVYNLIIKIPELNEQKAIAATLSALDDMIELNNQINKTLEEIAQAIFKSWFVDFEPFKDGEFEESELGLIPKGWRVVKNKEVFELSYGKALKAENRRYGHYPVVGSNGIVGYHDEYLVKGPGIVVGRKGNPGTVNYIFDNFYPIDTTFYIDTKISKIFLYFALKNQNLIQLSADSAVPGLNRNIAYMNSLLLPREDVLNKFDNVIQPIFDLVLNNQNEITHLQNIRDTLLPKLMSGEIRVPIGN